MNNNYNHRGRHSYLRFFPEIKNLTVNDMTVEKRSGMWRIVSKQPPRRLVYMWEIGNWFDNGGFRTEIEARQFLVRWSTSEEERKRRAE